MVDPASLSCQSSFDRQYGDSQRKREVGVRGGGKKGEECHGKRLLGAREAGCSVKVMFG